MAEPGPARGSWDIADLAAAARETPDRLEWYAQAGLLHRDGPDAFAADSLRRIRLIHHARRRGISDEDLALAIKEQGDLLGVFDELGTDAFTGRTLGEITTAAAIPQSLVDELVDLLDAEMSEPAMTEDEQAVATLAQALTLGLPEEALVQLLRVYADATGRIADAETGIFHTHVHEQFRAQGLTGKELLAATESIGKPALELAEPALLYFHRRAYQRANRDDLLRHLAEATTPPAARPGETTGTVMFVDLAGFTPLTLALGDSGVADVLHSFGSIVRRRASATGGRIIKQIGDAFMLVFQRPVDAIEFGVGAAQDCAADADLPALHIGAHHGPLLYRDGDYFGHAVNVAARVTSVSDAGQFVITQPLLDAVASAEVNVTPLPAVALKGVADPPVLFEVAVV